MSAEPRETTDYATLVVSTVQAAASAEIACRRARWLGNLTVRDLIALGNALRAAGSVADKQAILDQWSDDAEVHDQNAFNPDAREPDEQGQR